MAETKKDVKRKPLSKKLRFEVFKRDLFTCQYCGRKAPDVVLHVDHIKPVSKGGKNELMNMVTSCLECNLGKGAKTLSDQSTVERQRRQAEMLAQRREQIEMLRDWQIEMLAQENLEIDAVDALVNKLTNNEWSLSEYGRNNVRTLLKKYGMLFVMESLQAGYVSYGCDMGKTLNKLSGICYCRSNPAAQERVFLLNKMEKYDGFDRAEASNILRKGYKAGGDDFYRDVKDIISDHDAGEDWDDIKEEFYDLLESWEVA